MSGRGGNEPGTRGVCVCMRVHACVRVCMCACVCVHTCACPCCGGPRAVYSLLTPPQGEVTGEEDQEAGSTLGPCSLRVSGHPQAQLPSALLTPDGPLLSSLASEAQAHWMLSTTCDKRPSQVPRAQPCPGPSMAMCDVASDGLPWQDPAPAQPRPAKGLALPSSDPKPSPGHSPRRPT